MFIKSGANRLVSVRGLFPSGFEHVMKTAYVLLLGACLLTAEAHELEVQIGENVQALLGGVIVDERVLA